MGPDKGVVLAGTASGCNPLPAKQSSSLASGTHPLCSTASPQEVAHLPSSQKDRWGVLRIEGVHCRAELRRKELVVGMNASAGWPEAVAKEGCPLGE